MIIALRVFITFLLILLVGCSAGLYHKGKSAMDRGDYSEAVAVFEDAVEQEPERAILWRQLGIAYYKTDQYRKAVDAMKQATLLDPDDGTAVLYLGLSNEILGNDTEAVETYRAYLLSNPDDEISPRVRRRVKYLTDEKLKAEVQAVIQSESGIDPEMIPSNTVGVLGFETEKLEKQYAVLGRGLGEMLTTDLSKVSAIVVVERMRLNEVIRELEFSQSEVVDKQSAPRLGKLIGAATVVTGELDQPKTDELRASTGLISTSKGIASYPADVDAKLQHFFTLEKELLYNILDEMGYAPTEEEKKRLDSIPTTSLLAFLAYSRGLQYSDQGEFELAEAEFQAALDEDPNFEAAAEGLRTISGLGGYDGSLEPLSQLEFMLTSRTESDVPQSRSGHGLRTTHGTLGFQADETTPREGDNPRIAPKVKGTVTVTGTFHPDEP